MVETVVLCRSRPGERRPYAFCMADITVNSADDKTTAGGAQAEAEPSVLGQVFALGPQWPTIDPFLFCAHHLDAYPVANGDLGPAESLEGRMIGQDFAGLDGWNMYHGSSVPGFPQHPHRGFETITYVREGWCDHSDSLGAQARFGEGDVQWLTAGAGIVHSEMFPLFSTTHPNTLHLFQIWLNLPAANKMVDPYFSMVWAADIPKVQAHGAEITVIAGSLDGADAPAPPPDSWAAAAGSDVAVWHVRIDPHGVVELPAAAVGSNRVVYLFDGESVKINGEVLDGGHGALIDPSSTLEITTGEGSTAEGAEFLLLQGRPIGEPVAQHGPFVMNTQAEIHQAIEDYQRTRFGGWPWPADDPVHGPEPERFAVRPEVPSG